MKTPKFKEGDHIFYFSKELGTLQCVVTKVFAAGVVGLRVDGPNSKVVSEKKCQLQSEWAKENAL